MSLPSPIVAWRFLIDISSGLGLSDQLHALLHAYEKPLPFRSPIIYFHTVSTLFKENILGIICDPSYVEVIEDAVCTAKS